MATIKAKKGNPFEKDVAYSIMQTDRKVIRPDVNLAGVDLIAEGDKRLFIECKRHKAFSWNKLLKYFIKTREIVSDRGIPLLVFKSNQQPALVMYEDKFITVISFKDYFGIDLLKHPKGLKYYENQTIITGNN